MYFDVLGVTYFYIFFGTAHAVEILQTVIFFYIGAASCLFLLTAWSSDLKRFFFYSELAWLSLFGLCLALTFWGQTTLAFTNAFVILIFTAVEAVTLACLLLIASEGSPLSKPL